MGRTQMDRQPYNKQKLTYDNHNEDKYRGGRYKVFFAPGGKFTFTQTYSSTYKRASTLKNAFFTRGLTKLKHLRG
jgi:hypothetical protein